MSVNHFQNLQRQGIRLLEVSALRAQTDKYPCGFFGGDNISGPDGGNSEDEARTTEFMAFAKHHEAFQEINTELLGLSIDSYFSHIAWIRNIKERFGVDIQFPIIEDLSMNVARAYGMIHPGAADTSAVRSTFIIDPEGILRAMVYYPMSNGRSIPEFLRLIKAMQASDEHNIATPEGWQPGDKVIVPPPADMSAAQTRLDEGYECTDWYFCKKDL